jgi:hypothetical protein
MSDTNVTVMRFLQSRTDGAIIWIRRSGKSDISALADLSIKDFVATGQAKCHCMAAMTLDTAAGNSVFDLRDAFTPSAKPKRPAKHVFVASEQPPADSVLH